MSVRFSLLLLLLLQFGLAKADWTGIAMEFSNFDADWEFDEGLRKSTSSEISFQIEERTDTNLSVGAGIGYFNTRIIGGGSSPTRRLDGQFFRISLRQEVALTTSTGLTALFGFRYNSGSDGELENRVEIDWNQIDLQLGVSWQVSGLRVTPFVFYQDVDGDISDDIGTELLATDDPMGQGIRFDYFLEKTAFVRFEVRSGAQSGGLLTFARRY